MKIIFPLLVFSTLYIHGLLSQDNNFKVFGYLPHYRFDNIDQIDLSKLTHLCIGFANPDRQGKLHFGQESIFPVMVKAKSFHLKTLMTLAGGAMTQEEKASWDYWLKPWNRLVLVEEIMKWVDQYEFDGVDVDLEWNHVDVHYNGFVLDLKEALKKRNKILTGAMPGRKRYAPVSDEAIAAFDFIHMMAYDLTGPWAPHLPGPHAPYYFAENSIKFWKEQGVSQEKLILGIPLYGWDFSGQKQVYSVSYGFIVSRDTSFAYKDQFGDAYYNGISTVKAKTELALKSCGGIMFWELGQDSYNEFSLLRVAYDVLNEEALGRKSVQVVPLEKQDVPIIQVGMLPQQEKVMTTWSVFISPSQNKLYLVKKEKEGKSEFFPVPEYPAGIYFLNKVISTGEIRAMIGALFSAQ